MPTDVAPSPRHYCGASACHTDALRADVQAFLDADPDATALLSPTSIVVWVNRAFRAMFGYSCIESIGQPINVLVAPLDSLDEAEHIDDSVNSGESLLLDTMRRHRDGSLLEVTVSATPLALDGTRFGLIRYRSDDRRRGAERARAELRRTLVDEREDLSVTLAQLPIGILLVQGHARNVVYANHRANEILERLALADPTDPLSFDGVRRDGQTYSHDRWPAVRSLTTGDAVGGEEFRLRRVDGESAILRVSSRPLPVRKDSPRRAIAVLEDVTTERASEAAYRQVVEESIQGFALMRDGRFLFANEQFATAFDYSPRELLALPAWSVMERIHPGDHEAVRVRGRARDAGESTERGRIRILNPTRGMRWLEVAGCPVTYEGQPTSQLTTHDITDQVELEEQLKRAQHFEAIGQLAAGLAHEINTPAQYASDSVRFALDVVVKALGEAASSPGSPTAPDALAEIPDALTDALEGLGRITTLVQAVRRFSHPGTEQLAPTDLASLTDSAISVAKHAWKDCADVIRHIDRDLPPTPCRQADVGQALLNVLVNAAHAIRERQRADASLRGQIEVSVARAGEDVAITIRDNGVGIPQDRLTRIFDPFFTTKSVGEGTGYGLSQVYTTARAHGGTVWVDSTVNEGTSLTIRLPLV